MQIEISCSPELDFHGDSTRFLLGFFIGKSSIINETNETKLIGIIQLKKNFIFDKSNMTKIFIFIGISFKKL